MRAAGKLRAGCHKAREPAARRRDAPAGFLHQRKRRGAVPHGEDHGLRAPGEVFRVRIGGIGRRAEHDVIVKVLGLGQQFFKSGARKQIRRAGLLRRGPGQDAQPRLRGHGGRGLRKGAGAVQHVRDRPRVRRPRTRGQPGVAQVRIDGEHFFSGLRERGGETGGHGVPAVPAAHARDEEGPRAGRPVQRRRAHPAESVRVPVGRDLRKQAGLQRLFRKAAVADRAVAEHAEHAEAERKDAPEKDPQDAGLNHRRLFRLRLRGDGGIADIRRELRRRKLPLHLVGENLGGRVGKQGGLGRVRRIDGQLDNRRGIELLGGDFADVRFLHAGLLGGLGQQGIPRRQGHGGLHPAVEDVGVLQLIIAFRILGNVAGENQGGASAVGILGEFQREQTADNAHRQHGQDVFFPVFPEIPGDLRKAHGQFHLGSPPLNFSLRLPRNRARAS